MMKTQMYIALVAKVGHSNLLARKIFYSNICRKSEVISVDRERAWACERFEQQMQEDVCSFGVLVWRVPYIGALAR